MPAYHRAPKENVCQVDLRAGTNELVLELEKTEQVICTFLTSERPLHGVLDLVFKA